MRKIDEVIKVRKKITQKEYLKTAACKNSIWDFVGNYYRMYLAKGDKTEEKLNNFILLLKWDGTSNESVDVETLFQGDQYRQASEEVFPVVEKIIGNLVTENFDETVFYEKLFTKTFDDILFAGELEKICALTILVLDPKIPYYKLGPAMQMENDEFGEISQSIQEEISKAIFALQFGYSQKTELASQLYNIVKEQKDEKKRIVLIANILGFYSSQMEFLYEKANANTNSEMDEE
jgi:hypothetical protein